MPACSSEGREHLRELIRLTTRLVAEGRLSGFLPVVARIVTSAGESVVTASRQSLPKATPHGVQAIHAEVAAIHQAEALGFRAWQDSTMYVTLEPCYPCSKVLTESYGFGRVVYGVEDTTVAPYARNTKAYVDHGVELVQCNDESIRTQLLGLFAELRARDVYDSPLRRKFISRETEAERLFGREVRRSRGNRVQISLFDADLWAASCGCPDGRTFLLRHQDFLRLGTRRESPRYLLITGEAEAVVCARDSLTENGLVGDGVQVATHGEAVQKLLKGDADHSMPELFAFDYDGTLADPGSRVDTRTAEALAELLVLGNYVAIMTSRSADWLEGIESDAVGLLTTRLRGLLAGAGEEAIRGHLSRFCIVCARGALRCHYTYADGVAMRAPDLTRLETIDREAATLVRQVIGSVLSRCGMREGVEISDGYALGRLVRIRIRALPHRRHCLHVKELASMLQRRISTSRIAGKVCVDVCGNSVGVGVTDKGRALARLATAWEALHVRYFADDPEGTDASVFALGTRCGPAELDLYHVSSPEHTVRVVSLILMALSARVGLRNRKAEDTG